MKIGDRITVNMDQDSERQFDWENNIRINYEGFEDDVIQKIEAGNISSWKKYVGAKGVSLGIERFGESAPYKKIYEHLNLSVEKIVTTIQARLRK